MLNSKLPTRLMGILIACTLLSIQAFATEKDCDYQFSDEEEIGNVFISDSEHSVKPASKELLAATSLDEVAIISRRNFENDPIASSPDSTATAQKMLDEYFALVSQEDPAVTYSSGPDAKSLTAFMVMADGLSPADTYKVKTISDAAKSEAQSKYPNDPYGLQDTYRHFTWNHRLTRELSKKKAQIVGCDYEWGAVLLKYANSSYKDYLAQGYKQSEALTKSYQHAYFMREDCYSLCDAKCSTFTALFNKASIRDFYNNFEGRMYADRYNTSRSEAFTAAQRAKALINSDGGVTESHINTVWSLRWYKA